jgi:N-acetylmuramoyl-L-alanine amidase
MSNTSIVVCGHKYDIGTRVVLWDESDGFCAYGLFTHHEQDRKTGKEVLVKKKHYSSRLLLGGTPDFQKLTKLIWQFALHHSGLYRSKDTFETLQERGLSVHFILDDNGILYQTLDVCERAYHIGTNNVMSVGVEIDSRALASKYPGAYDDNHQKAHGVGPRRVLVDSIHGMKMKGFAYSDAQYATLAKLGKCLVNIFPLSNPDFPRDEDGNIVKTNLSNPEKFEGIICHYQVTRSKIDPISFEYDRFLLDIGQKSISVQPSVDVPKELDLSTWECRQKALKQLGFDPGQIDGVFGLKTKTALQEFQKSCGLIADGIFGPKTEEKMKGML